MTEDHRRCFSYLGITLLVISGALAAQGRLPKYDIAGIWLFDVDTPRAKGIAEVTVKQDGGKLSGHYSSPAFGENDFTGSIQGTIAVGPWGRGTFTAARKPEKSR